MREMKAPATMEAQSRWRHLISDRTAEAEKLQPAARKGRASSWDARARHYAAQVLPPGPRHPLLVRVSRAAGPQGTVVDVGAGPGVFALPLASRVKAVVAVDSSRVMLSILRRQARRLSLDNVTCVNASWEEAEVRPAEVVLCSYVLPSAANPAAFLRRVDRTATKRSFVYLDAASFDLVVDPFWRHFHGRPRRPLPSYLDLVAVLRELGMEPRVEIVEKRNSSRFATMAIAVSTIGDRLLLPDTAEARRELEALLAPWLVRRNGAFATPLRSVPAAIVSWAPQGERRAT